MFIGLLTLAATIVFGSLGTVFDQSDEIAVIIAKTDRSYEFMDRFRTRMDGKSEYILDYKEEYFKTGNALVIFKSINPGIYEIERTINDLSLCSEKNDCDKEILNYVICDEAEQTLENLTPDAASDRRMAFRTDVFFRYVEFQIIQNLINTKCNPNKITRTQLFL